MIIINTLFSEGNS